MKGITKNIKRLLCVFMALVVILLSLVCRTLIVRNDICDDTYQSNLKALMSEHITLKTEDGVVIYKNGEYANNKKLRKATLHLTGAVNGAIENNLVNSNLEKTVYKQDNCYFKDVEVRLTIDSKLQQSAYKTMTEQKYSNKGCFIIANYKTGEIKALVSLPTTDSQKPAKNLEDGTYLNIALTNQCIGSVFKAVTVAAVLELHPEAKNFKYYCTGKYKHISCSYGAHGQCDLSRILYKSCNCGIAKLTETYLSTNEMRKFVELVGLKSKNQIAELPSYKKGKCNPIDDLLWCSNGQSTSLFSPISILNYYSVICNNGTKVEAHITKDTKPEKENIISKSTCQFIKNALEPVSADGGCKYKSFGKTGTAELRDGVSNSVYVSCITDEKAEPLSVMCFLYKGGSSLNSKKVVIDYINQNL